ncbi:MAG: ATP-dependent RecD-like DNA helicase [Clostridiales Family XIII bacterium]|jgi:exodeoxyribonuclease V alpha subunit|nr:ATP-dependent RecD-like DNA helicase [Clostridiales Family XIII bacterium]
MEEKTGILTEIIYRNAENGYTVAVFRGTDETFTATGVLHDASAGRRCKLTGYFKEHPVYGRQFSFSEYTEEMPDTDEAIEMFLASGSLKGVGKKTAAAIVAAFGADALRVIEEEPHRLMQIDGIGPKKATDICESFKEHRELAEVTLYFRQFGVSVSAAIKMYSIYGAAAIEAVNENPYRLVDDVFGIGFKSADRIAAKMGCGAADAHRLKSGLAYLLAYYANDGSTFVPKALLLDKATELLDVPRDDIEERLLEMVFEGETHIENLEGRPVVFLEAYFAAEQSVCRDLLRLDRATPKPISADVENLIAATESATGVTLSENQKYAVRESLESGVFVITGGPGTGKTTIINAIINILRSSGLRTGIAAPTGRAAKRITETSGHEASTIHRMLEYYYAEAENAMRFGRTAENRLDYDAVIVDEASMIDILLMKALLLAMPSGARLIIVGDADQLPPVGAGNVLRDMLESEILHSVNLSEIFRQAAESLIVVNAHRINRGEYPAYNEKDKDFFLLQRSGDLRILATIKELCATRLPDYYSDCDVLHDLQVLTPIRKGMLGCVNLNKELQAVLNPPAPHKTEKPFGDRVFREGDKVMQTKNNYGLAWRRLADASSGEGIFNGDVGFIKGIDAEDGRVTVVFDEDRFVTYEFSQLEELDLAYAVTVHKSQGSEFPLILMPLSRFPPTLATRNLLYTAVTRGKRAAILVGAEKHLWEMVNNTQTKERYSGLRARLRAFLPGGAAADMVSVV